MFVTYNTVSFVFLTVLMMNLTSFKVLDILHVDKNSEINLTFEIFYMFMSSIVHPVQDIHTSIIGKKDYS